MKSSLPKQTGRTSIKGYFADVINRIKTGKGNSFSEVELKKLNRLFYLLFNFSKVQLQVVNQQVKPTHPRRMYSSFYSNTILLAFIMLISVQVIGQKAPSSFTTGTQVPAKKSATVNGYGVSPEYPAANSYKIEFGKQNASTDGVNHIISGFVVDGLTYKPIPRAGSTPYDNVIIKRKANPKVSDLGKFTAFYQNNGGVPAPTTKVTAPGTTLYYPPEYVGSMESLINSYIVNRGTDNLFANDNGVTLNNIERVDMIITDGVTAADVVKTGFLLMERGGNDPYKIAAITSLTPSGEIATLGNLINGPTTAWGSSGIPLTSTVFQRNTGDAEIRPNQNVPTQDISGSYVSFQSLGIPAKTTIYGIALFADDVTSSTDLINLTNVPLNTGAKSGIGGLDFMAGGGFFVEEHHSLAFSLSGNIFDDGNGLTNSLIDGIGTGIPGGSQLYAYLAGSDNLIKAKVTVTPSGTFEFDNQLMGNTDYTVVISTANLALGSIAPEDAALPAGWVITGDSFGNSNQAGSGIQSGIPDLKIAVKAIDASITNVNFGIEQRPVAGSGEVTLPNPGGSNSATVPAGTFTNISSSSDADGFIKSVIIAYPSANANSITINGTKYTASEFAVAFPSNASITTDASGNPTQTIEVDPVDGNTTVVIPFIAVDNAGVNSSNTGTATINFTLVDHKPVAVNDENSTDEDTPVSGSVTGNDTPSEDGGNVWSLVGDNGGATHGTVTMNTDGTYTYTPAANYNGTDVFNYKVCDADDDCSNATVTITIVPVDDAPVAVNDVNSTDEDTPVNGDVTVNDTPSGDGGNVWSLNGTNGGAAHGTVTMNPDGTYTYAPAANYNGTDAFDYKVCDADNDCSNATVTITIVPVDDAPVAVNDVNSTDEDTPVNGDVTVNDTPSGDGGNVWSLVGTNGGAAHGTVTMNPDGTYTYTPAANYNGTDAFDYKVCDADNDCSNATVTITIIPVDDAPVAVNDVNSTNEDTPVNGDVTVNDTPSGDGGNVWSLNGTNGGAAHGTVTMNTDGKYIYTPAANYNGTDVFNYKVCDADNDCSNATVTITIVPVDDAPIAVNDVNSTNEDTPVNGDVTVNDTPSGDGGNIWSLNGTNGGAAHGTVTMNTDGKYTYTPAANYNGTDVFNYKVCDADNDCSNATVTITIVPVDDAPVAVNDVNSTDQNVPVSGTVITNDTPSGDGGNVWSLVGTNGGATHGTVTMNPDGTYTYTPAANYSGTDIFTYKLCDADNDCSNATVTITIKPVITYCGCTPSASDILTNGSFENGVSNWQVSGGILTNGTGYAVCGNKNAYLQRTSGTAKMWQDVAGIPVGSTVTLKAWAGTHTLGIGCNPKLILAFYNSSGSLISSASVKVDKDVDKPDYKLKEYTLTGVVPAGTVKVRVEGNIACNWLKLDAVCLTVSNAPTGSIGNFVWNDKNNNGKQDSGEPGIAGASVKLTYPGGSTAVKTTDNNGAYSFTALATGVYKVTFTTPSGYTAASANVGDDNLDSDPVNGDVSVTLASNQTNNSIDAGFYVKCTNTTQHTETYPNQYNTGFTTSLNNKTFAGSSGTWTANSNSNATIVVVKPYYSASTSYALKIVNYKTGRNSVGSCSATSPKLNLSGACCPEQLKMTFTLWTYTCVAGDNNASFKVDFSSNNGSSWTEIASATSAQLYSAYGANGKVVLTIPVPAAYQNANFKYRFRGEMGANNPNNFYLFIDDISITSPASCTSSSRGVATNTLWPAQTSEISDQLTVKVLSNPSKSAFQLNVKSGAAEGITLRITDLFGRTLKVINNVQSNTTLNVGEDLQPGNYFVEVKQNTNKKVLKLVKL